MGWSAAKHTQLLTHSPLHPQQDRWEKKGKSRKTHRLRYRQFNKWKKEGKINQRVIPRQSLTTSHRQADAQTVCKQQPPWKPKPPHTFLFYPIFIKEHDAIWSEIALLPVWVGCPSCVLPKLLPRPSLLPVRAKQEKDKRRDSASTAQPQQKHCCAIITGLVTNPKHSTPQDAVKNANSISSRLNTARNPQNSDVICICHIIAHYIKAPNQKQVICWKMLSAYGTVPNLSNLKAVHYN